MPVPDRFNPAASFVVRKPMTLGGAALTLGDPFPKEAVAERRLRQLYMGRWLEQLPPATAQPKKEKKRGI